MPRAAIRRYVEKIAKRFHPDRVILFGSHAYGKPDEDSDVDLLVVMPCFNELTQSVRIDLAVEAPLSVDLIVRTPENLAMRLAWNDWFLRETVEKGIVLYDAAHEEWLRKAKADLRVTRREIAARPVFYDVVCFHCQQSAEKFLKGLLHECGQVVPRTHLLPRLLNALLPQHPALRSLRGAMSRHSRFAVDYRYPGLKADGRLARSSLSAAEGTRSSVRQCLGLRPRP